MDTEIICSKKINFVYIVAVPFYIFYTLLTSVHSFQEKFCFCYPLCDFVSVEMEPSPTDVLEKATAVGVSNPEQAMIMLQTLGKILNNPIRKFYII